MKDNITISLNGNKSKKDNKTTKTLNIEESLWEQFNVLCEKNYNINRTECFNQLLKAGFMYLKEQNEKDELYNSCEIKGIPFIEGQIINPRDFFSLCCFFSQEELDYDEFIEKKYFIYEEEYDKLNEIQNDFGILPIPGAIDDYTRIYRIDFILVKNNRLMITNIATKIIFKESSTTLKKSIIKQLSIEGLNIQKEIDDEDII